MKQQHFSQAPEPLLDELLYSWVEKAWVETRLEAIGSLSMHSHFSQAQLIIDQRQIASNNSLPVRGQQREEPWSIRRSEARRN